MEVQTPEQLSQAPGDGAPVWSSGDQKTAPPASQEPVFPKDGVLQLDSSQVIKVKALRRVADLGGEVQPRSALTPNAIRSDRASSCWCGLARPRGSEPGPGVSITTNAGISPVTLVILLERLEDSLALGLGLGSWERENGREGSDPEVCGLGLSPSSVPPGSVT